LVIFIHPNLGGFDYSLRLLKGGKELFKGNEAVAVAVEEAKEALQVGQRELLVKAANEALELLRVEQAVPLRVQVAEDLRQVVLALRYYAAHLLEQPSRLLLARGLAGVVHGIPELAERNHLVGVAVELQEQ